MNKKSVFKALRNLESRGLISRSARDGRTTRIDPTTRGLNWVDPKENPGTNSGRDPGPILGRDPTQNEPHEGTPVRVSHKGSEKNTARSVSDRFVKFWNSYGLKSDRKKCEKKFARLPVTEQEKATAFAPIYRTHCAGGWLTQRNPSTYLNNRIWNDEQLPDGTPIEHDERGFVTGLGRRPEKTGDSGGPKSSFSESDSGPMRGGVRRRSARSTAASTDREYLRDAGFSDAEIGELFDRGSDGWAAGSALAASGGHGSDFGDSRDIEDAEFRTVEGHGGEDGENADLGIVDGGGV